MLRIRFSRTGKVGQPSYRIVVAEHRAPVKGRYLEALGNYLPARKEKQLVLEKERVLHWISKGAIPSESVASLLKKNGMENMDKYMGQPTHQRKKKGEEEAAKAAAPAAQPAAKAEEPKAPAEAPAK